MYQIVKRFKGFSIKSTYSTNIKQITSMWLILFFLSKVYLFSEILPLGIGFYLVIRNKSTINKIIPISAILLGTLSNLDYKFLFIYIGFIFLFELIYSVLIKFHLTNVFITSTLGTVMMLISMLLSALINGFSLYVLVTILFNSSIILFTSLLFMKIFSSGFEENNIFDYKAIDIKSFAFLVGLASSGLIDFNATNFSIYHFICFLFAFIFCIHFGIISAIYFISTSSFSVLFSETIGTTFYPVLGIYILVIVCTFTVVKHGRFWSVIAGAIGYLGSRAILYRAPDSVPGFLEFLLGALVFLLIPIHIDSKRTLSNTEILNPVIQPIDYAENKLKCISNAFDSISKIIAPSSTNDNSNNSKLTNIIEKTADKICYGCSLSTACWGDNFYKTYAAFSQAISKIENGTAECYKDLEVNFASGCIKTDHFYTEALSICKTEKINLFWQKKLDSFKYFLPLQLQALSSTVENIAVNLTSSCGFMPEKEEEIESLLLKEGIEQPKVMLMKNELNKLCLQIHHNGCGGMRKCISVFEKVSSKVLNTNMVCDFNGCTMNYKAKSCKLLLKEKDKYGIITGIARQTREGSVLSGDSFTFMNTDKGQYVIALSDGMGSGKLAENISSKVIGIIEHFAELGLDNMLNANIINAFLSIDSDQEYTASMDLSLIDLHNGTINFSKCGAPPSFIMRKKNTEVISCDTIPAGILDYIEIEDTTNHLKDGEFLIMMSDGIYDSFPSSTSKNREIKKILASKTYKNPQEIADFLLTTAVNNCKNTPSDDMTIIVSKFWKKAG